MGLYELFRTNPDLEKNGVEYEGENFLITIARAGGANKRYARMLEQHSRPYRRALQTETLGNDKAMELLYMTYADAVIIAWKTKVNGEWVEGIEGPDGELLPFTRDNVIMTFKQLPDLFLEIQEQSGKVSIYRQDILESEAGN